MTYLESSALVSLFLPDRHTAAIRAFLAGRPGTVLTSLFGAAEYASALSIALRTGRLTAEQADRALRVFDAWSATGALVVDVDPADLRLAGGFVRRFDLGLRAPDALHVAICRRLGAALGTFDERQALAAGALGVERTVLA